MNTITPRTGSLGAAILVVSLSLLPDMSCATTVYFPDAQNAAIMQVTSGGAISTYLQDPIHLNLVGGVAFDSSGTLYVTTVDTFADGIAASRSPQGLWSNFDHSTDLPFTDIAAHSNGHVALLRRESGSGNYSVGGVTFFNDVSLSDIAIDGAGNIFFVQMGNIQKIGAAGGSGVSTFSSKGTAGLFATSITVDAFGAVYACGVDQGSNVSGLFRVQADGSYFLVAQGISGYMAPDTDGSIFINSSGTLYDVTSAGAVSTVATGLPNTRIATMLPEPDAAVMLMMGGILTGIRRRRRVRA